MPDIEVHPLKILSEKLETIVVTFISLLPNITAAAVLLLLTWAIVAVARCCWASRCAGRECARHCARR